MNIVLESEKSASKVVDTDTCSISYASLPEPLGEIYYQCVNNDGVPDNHTLSMMLRHLGITETNDRERDFDAIHWHYSADPIVMRLLSILYPEFPTEFPVN
ncbi:hypothetical protein ACQ4M3_39530 [Leptolyngbya sp. AN03gr2]|uniref:hypothetical protein n=1 Tax=unclassified Leptolyngbya TaxID=2650499 RepID=UPI003D31DE24